MFSADEKTIAELRDLRECLAAIDPAEATVLGLALEGELSRRTPDLTRVLLRAADSAGKHGLALGRTLTAACCRAFCARLGDLHPGAAIEVRVPPWAAVQVSFGDGPNTPGDAPERGGDGTLRPPGPGHRAALLGRGRSEGVRFPSGAGGCGVSPHSTLMCRAISHGVTCLR